MGGRFIRATALAASTVRSAFPGHQVDGRWLSPASPSWMAPGRSFGRSAPSASSPTMPRDDAVRGIRNASHTPSLGSPCHRSAPSSHTRSGPARNMCLRCCWRTRDCRRTAMASRLIRVVRQRSPAAEQESPPSVGRGSWGIGSLSDMSLPSGTSGLSVPYGQKTHAALRS